MIGNAVFGKFAVSSVLGYVIGLCFINLDPLLALFVVMCLIISAVLICLKTVFEIATKKPIAYARLLFVAFLFMLIFGIARISLWKTAPLSLLKSLNGRDATFEAEIVSAPTVSNIDGYTSAEAFVSAVKCRGKTYKMNDKVYLSYKEKAPLKFGDKIKFSATINTDQTATGYKSTNCVLPIRATGYLKDETQKARPRLVMLYKHIGIFIKEKICSAADIVFAQNSESSAVVCAIITGDKTEFSDHLYNNFADAGFLHIAAVSGMHVSILLSAFSSAVAAIGIKRKTAIFICPIVIFLFCSVANFTPSVLRASIMATLAMLSSIFNREYDSVNALFISALIILIIYPYALFSAGFLLSFGATLGICLTFNPLMNIGLIKNLPSFLKWLISGLMTSVSAFLGMTIFEIYFFDEINLTALITNIWIVPSVTYLFCFGLLSCIVHYICPPVAIKILKYLTEPFIRLTVKTAEIFSAAGNISFKIGFMPAAFYGYYICGFIILLYILTGRDRR